MIPKLTAAGKNLLLRALTGDTINFTKIQIGNGAAQNPAEATALSNPVLTVQLSSITAGDEYVTLTATFTNGSVTSGFRITEAGFFAEDPDNEGTELLYAIGNEDASTADYVPNNTNRILEMQFDALIFIGDAENVTAAIGGSLVYATAAELSAHTSDTTNPHGTTKTQVGLGNVPNVSTDDQRPTYDDATILTTLSSGEKVSTAFGKIKLAITNLINHINDRSNPHGVTALQVGAAASLHTHSAANINSGTLSVSCGGTGVANPLNGGILRGNGTDACSVVRGVGALFSPTVGTPAFGTLPVSMGGTGVTTQADLLSLISGNIFATGAFVGDGVPGRIIDLGFYPKAVLLLNCAGNTRGAAHEMYGGLALRDCNVIDISASGAFVTQWSNSYCVLGVVPNGFIVNYNSSRYIQSNENGRYYYYIAIK